MNIPKILAGTIFNLLGCLILYKSIRTALDKNKKWSFIETISGIAFMIIGTLIWLGYID